MEIKVSRKTDLQKNREIDKRQRWRDIGKHVEVGTGEGNTERRAERERERQTDRRTDR